MTEPELIAKQQIKIEKLKKKLKSNKQIKSDLHNMFYNIGAPLNDNRLKMDKSQLTWCAKVYMKIEEIKSI